LLRYKWTNEEIKAQLAKKKEIMRRFDPSERERISRLLEEAREKGDEQKVEELQDQLDQLGAQRLAFRTSLAPTKNSSAARDTEQDRLAERNRENRRLNQEAVRKAQLKEKARAREIENAIKRGEQVADDPSRRVRTKAKFVHDINEKVGDKPAANGADTGSPANGTPKSGATRMQVLPHLAKLQEEKHNAAKGVPSIHKPLMDDDVIGALDLDIDVEI
jgi:RNA polymerase-associated protein RTF1